MSLPRRDVSTETWLLLGLSALALATLCGLTFTGCSDSDGLPPGNIAPVVSAHVAPAHVASVEAAVVAQINSASAILGEIQLGKWTLFVTDDRPTWDSWIAARGLPANASGWTDHSRSEMGSWAHNGAGDLYVVEAAAHEAAHAVAPPGGNNCHATLCPQVDIQARACSQWIVVERAAGRFP